jgi:hypothetical protein
MRGAFENSCAKASSTTLRASSLPIESLPTGMKEDKPRNRFKHIEKFPRYLSYMSDECFHPM